MCDFESMSSIISHVTSKHNISLKEYRDAFSGAIVQRWPLSQKSKMSEIMSQDDKIQKLLKNRSFPSEIKHWIRKGFSEHEARQQVIEHQKMLALKQNNPKTKEHQRIKASGDSNPMSLRSISSRYEVSIEEAVKLTPCYGRVGSKHPMHGKKHKPESLAKIIENSFLKISKRSETEKHLYDCLIDRGYNIDHNVALVNRFNCDIVFRDAPLVIELFGDFWHCNPRFWSADSFNSVIKMTAKEKWDKDAQKLDTLRSGGYNVIVVWEYDWKNTKEQVIKEIVDAANSIS
jgi:G:T-mismatch repair DNA endonuclease (very short patch repair protein)